MHRISRPALARVAGAALLALTLPLPATAEDALAALQQQMQAMKRDYDTRIRALEARVAAAETAAHEARARAADAERSASAPAPGATAGAQAANAFNPAVSMILQGRYAAFGGAGGERPIPGFLLGEETGRGPEGLSLGESELDISANIDDRFYGFFDVAFSQDGGETGVEIEEAYLQTLALPAGLTLKAGQFLSGIGYQNARHSHTWDFVDQPLAYEAFLNNQYLDPGVQLSWVAPTDLYIELGAEAFRGDAFPAGGAAHDGLGTTALYAKASGDVGASSTWKAGLSLLRAEPRDREATSAGGSPLLFSGDSTLAIADFVWKWAPNGNFRERNFVFQTEYLYRHEDGSLQLGEPEGPLAGRYRGHQHGFYAQGVYQFVPRWRFGARYDQLWSDNRVTALPETALDRDGRSPWRLSAMLDFSNSEFSRLRLQYGHEGGGLGNDDLVFLQYIMSIGSHGAHQF